MTSLNREQESVVFVVDDDKSLREAISALLRVVGLKVECFASARDFMKSQRPDAASCLILDVRLPGASGLNLQEDLARAGIQIPIIFMTAHADIPMTVRAMKAGAIEFLTKPFRDQDILDAVQAALARDRDRREQEKSTADLRANYSSLTPREREIMELVTAGLMNKQIAGKIGVSEVTVKIHRGNLTRKLGARSIADLVKMAQALGLNAEKS